MKISKFKTIFFFIVVNAFLISNVYCQINHVVYKFQPSSNLKSDAYLASIKNMTSQEIKLIESVIKNRNELEFELFYDSKTAIYRTIEKLAIENEDYGAKMAKNSFGNQKYYKNIETKEKQYQTEFIGNIYNVILLYDQYKWEITTETKIISGYTCHKANATYQDMYNPIKKTANIFNPFVWFCPMIPCNFGPAGLDGLPGLVLEASLNGKSILFADKIEFDIKTDFKIEKPKGGKNITEKDLENIFIEQYKKTQE